MQNSLKCVIVVLAAVCMSAYGAESSDQNKGQGNQFFETLDPKISKIEDLTDTTPEKYISFWRDYADWLRQQNKIDSLAVWNAARAINRSLDELLLYPDADKATDLPEFLASVKKNAQRLIEISYTDEYHHNEILSAQIQDRLNELVKDAINIGDPKNIGNSAYRQDFQYEFNLFTERYVNSKRFRIGIGLTYTYIPIVEYEFVSKIDFSEFQTNISGGSNRFAGNVAFQNNGYPSIALVAKVPNAKIRLDLPQYSESVKDQTPVRQDNFPGISDPVFYRTTTKAKLELAYDLNLSFSVPELIRGDDQVSQHDWGFGIGIIGINIELENTTDVRSQTNSSQAFADMKKLGTLEDTDVFDDISVYLSGYYGIHISDTLSISVGAKVYCGNDLRECFDNDLDDDLETSGITSALELSWYL